MKTRAVAIAASVPLLGAAGLDVIQQVPADIPPVLWWLGTLIAPTVALLAYEAAAHALRRLAAKKRARARALTMTAKQLLSDAIATNDEQGRAQLLEAAELEASAGSDEQLADRVAALGRRR